MQQVAPNQDFWHVLVLVFVCVASVSTSYSVESRRQAVRIEMNKGSVWVAGAITSVDYNKSAVLRGPHGVLLRFDYPGTENDPGGATSSPGTRIAIHPGDQVILKGRFAAPRARRNPYDFDEEAYYRSKNWLGSIDEVELITINHQAHARRLAHVLFQIRQEFLNRLETRFLSEENKYLIAALLLGDRSGISGPIQTDFQRTGLGHILAISGLHVGIIAGFVHFILRVLVLRVPVSARIRRKLLAGTSFLCVWLFVGLVGLSASVVRSAIMLSVFLISSFTHRRWGSGHPLWPAGVAGYFILLVRPNDILAPGFQLSFGAVTFILWMVSLEQRHKTKHPIRSAIVSAMKITCAASLGTAPFLAYYFGFVPLGALLFSPIAVLLLSFLVPVVLVSIMLPFGFSSFSTVSELMLNLLIKFSSMGANISWIPSWVGPLYTFPAEIWLPSLVFLMWVYKKHAVVHLLLLGLMAFFSLQGAFQSKKEVTITFLDVGQGDAAVIESPSGNAFVVDLGPNSWSGKSVFKHLQARALTPSYSLLLTHGHSDHVGGLPAFIDQARQTQLLRTDELPQSIFQAGWLKHLDPHIQSVFSGGTIKMGKEIRLFVLNPWLPGAENNDSIVLLLVYGESKVLLMGDAEQEVEMEIVNLFSQLLNAQVIKIGHHGSRSSSTNQLLTAVKPTIGVISAGSKNSFGHPHIDVLQRLENHQISVLQTSTEGAVVIRLDGHISKQWNWK